MGGETEWETEWETERKRVWKRKRCTLMVGYLRCVCGRLRKDKMGGRTIIMSRETKTVVAGRCWWGG